jgi:hypothetical protein
MVSHSLHGYTTLFADVDTEQPTTQMYSLYVTIPLLAIFAMIFNHLF